MHHARLYCSTWTRWRARLTWSHRKRELAVMALVSLMAALGAVSFSRASGSAGPQARSVVVSSPRDLLLLTIVTDAPSPPVISVYSLQEPDRIVVDLPGFTWQPGATARLLDQTLFTRELRVGQFSLDPPITRLVLALRTPGDSMRYRRIAGATAGTVALEFATYAAGAPLDHGWEVIAHFAGAALPVSTDSSRTPHRMATRADRALPPTIAPVAGEYSTSRGITFEKDFDQAGTAPIATMGKSQDAGSRTNTASLFDDGWTRLALAFVVLLATGIMAILVRRRFQPLIALEEAVAAEEEIATIGEAEAAPSTERNRFPAAGPPAAAQAQVLPATTGEAASAPPLTSESIPPEARVQTLVGALAAHAADAYPSVVQELLEIACAGHTDALMPYLKAPEAPVRAIVAGVLGEAGAAQAIEGIARLLNDADAAVRASALYALAQLGEAAAVHAEAARARLSDPDAAVRTMAVDAVTSLLPYSELVAQQVLNLLADPEPAVRQTAASAVFQFANRGLDAPVVDLLSDFTRRAEALAMLQYADDDTMWHLLGICQSRPTARARHAVDVLTSTMSVRWTAGDFTSALASSDPAERLHGLQGLTIVGGPAAVRMARCLAASDPAPAIRARAAELVSAWEASASPQQNHRVLGIRI